MNTRSTRPVLFAVVIAASIPLCVPSEVRADDAKTIEDIRALFATTNKAIADKKGVSSQRYDFFVNAAGKWEWTVIPNGAAEKEEDVTQRATLFWVECRPAKLVLGTTSFSGDWFVTDEYYFHPNGSVAFWFRQDLTYLATRPDDAPPGPVLVEERSYFDVSGRRVKYLQGQPTIGAKYKLPSENVASSPFKEQLKAARQLPPPPRNCSTARDGGR